MTEFGVSERPRFADGFYSISEFSASGPKKICLVGSPNTGKSLLLDNLTGSYVTVFNYLGTTVEVQQCLNMTYVIDEPRYGGE